MAKFLALGQREQTAVFAAWSARFGSGVAKNAERAYPDWRSGARGMTQATRERIAELVPPVLPRNARVELARTLWRDGRRRNDRPVVIADPVQAANLGKAYDEAARALRGTWAVGFPGTERWLTADVAKEVAGQQESEEADARAQALTIRREIERHLAVPAPRPAAVFEVPLRKGQLTVVVPKLKHPIWRVVRPVLKAAIWAAVFAGISAAIYLWPSTQESAPAKNLPAAQAPAATIARSPATPARTSVVAAATQQRTYTVQPGDGWSAIAAKLGVTTAALYAANGLSGPTKALYAGDVILIPAGAGSSGSASGAAGGPVAGAPGCFVAGRDTCNCADFSSSSAATTFMRTFDPADVNRLDGDNDGIACDAGPGTSSGSGSGTRVGAICGDGTTSTATGSGACSHHGGVASWLTR